MRYCWEEILEPPPNNMELEIHWVFGGSVVCPVCRSILRELELIDRLKNPMQHYLSVLTDAAGVVHIDRQTGVMFWEEENLDPILKQYAKKYIVDEGFLEQALGALEPLPDREIDSFFDDANPA